MIKIIKEFLMFRKLMNSFQMIELNDVEKNKLEAFDKDLLRKIIYHSVDNLAKEIIDEWLTTDYIRWYKHWLFHLLNYFKIYK